MLRGGLAADRRHEAVRSSALIQAQAVAAAQVESASGAAAVAAAVDAAVTGDLPARSPALAAKLQELDDRLAALE